MFRKIIATSAGSVVLLVCTGLSRSDAQTVRQPLGVYAHVDVDDAIAAYKAYRRSPAWNGEDEHTYLRNLYGGMFEGNPGLAGITFGIYWDRIEKNDPDCAFYHDCSPGGDVNGNDWGYLDDVFTEAKAFSKTVQLIITPGVDSPPWLFKRLLPSCDVLFLVSFANPQPCGEVTFSVFPEDTKADGHVFPLPWDGTYQFWWGRFLSEVNDRYKDRREFVSIAIAGPIGASTEMILPTTLDGSFQSPAWPADEAWSVLIANSFPNSSVNYQHSDQVFVKQWKKAIDAYEGIFKNVTLFLSPDSGDKLPEFGRDEPPDDPGWLFTADCSTAADYPMSCKAKTDVLTYFLATEGGRQLATQVGGMTASSALTPEAGNSGIGVGGVKVLTGPLSQSPPILGGAEFDKPVSTKNLATREEQGCTSAERMAKECKGISPELAAYNTLRVFFYGTEFGHDYGWPKNTAATGPMQWLEIDYRDIVWAQTNDATANNGTPCNRSLENLINGASWYLFKMARQMPPVAPPSCNR